MKQMYEDLFYNLDYENFANPKIFADQIVTKELLAEKISSETIVTDTISAYYGDIAELTVDWIDTSRRISRYLLGDTSDMYYFEGHEQKLIFIHAVVLVDEDGEPVTEHLKNRYGYPMYWEKDISEADLDAHGVPYIDKIRVAVTLKDTGVPVIVYVYEPQLSKLSLAFTPEKTAVPMIILGAGTGIGNNGKLMMYKDMDGPVFVYKTKDGKDTALYALDDGKWYYNGVEINTGIGGGGESGTTGNFDALEIGSTYFIVTTGGNKYTFDTPKDEYGRITSVNGGGKNRPITYK